MKIIKEQSLINPKPLTEARGNGNGEWGVRWSEFNSSDRVVKKEKFFTTEKARTTFTDKLEQKDNFKSFEAWLNPKTEEAAPLNEKINQANADINAKIFRVLKTKKEVEPKFGEDLAKHNITILGGDDSHSIQGYYAVKGPNGNQLCVSKGSNGKLGLFDQWSHQVSPEAFDKFDYLNYLTSSDASQDNRRYSGTKPYFKDPKASYIHTEDDVNKNTSTFKTAKAQAADYGATGFHQKYSRQDIDRNQAKIAELQKDIERQRGYIAGYDKQSAEQLQKAADILAAIRTKHQK